MTRQNGRVLFDAGGAPSASVRNGRVSFAKELNGCEHDPLESRTQHQTIKVIDTLTWPKIDKVWCETKRAFGTRAIQSGPL